MKFLPGRPLYEPPIRKTTFLGPLKVFVNPIGPDWRVYLGENLEFGRCTGLFNVKLFGREVISKRVPLRR